MRITTTHVAERFGISKATVHLWAREFAPHLSADANPAKGVVRVFTDADMEVFATVAAMRGANQSYDDIRATLETGARIETAPPAGDQAADDAPQADQPGRAIAAIESVLDTFRGNVDRLERKVETLETALDAERGARHSAETAAAEMRGELVTTRRVNQVLGVLLVVALIIVAIALALALT